MSLIRVLDLSFSYKGSFEDVFNNVSFSIDSDWKLGFIGRNGRGKTTFLRLLMGELEYSGRIDTNEKFDYFPFDVENKSLCAYDIADDILITYEKWALDKELALLEVSEGSRWRAFDSLSGGEQTKILLAILFLKNNSFLLIDEPTNHLDITARRAVCRYLASKKSFILVSHDRDFLDGCVDHILSINKTGIEVQSGNFSSWLVNKQRKDSFELNKNRKLSGEIERLKEAYKRKSAWANSAEDKKEGASDKGFMGAKAARQMKTATIIRNRQERAIEEKSALLSDIERTDSLKLSPLTHSSDTLVTARELSLRYGDNTILSNLSFTIEEGSRVALMGKNGSGKSSLLKLIVSKAEATLEKRNALESRLSMEGNSNLIWAKSNEIYNEGEGQYEGYKDGGASTEGGNNILKSEGMLSLASRLKVSYVPQNTSFLEGRVRDFATKYGLNETLFMAILAKLDFSRTQLVGEMSAFSAGQKKKILIAKSLCEEAHLYIWDEPLNYIDLLSRLQIESLIKEFRPTLLFVEHDSRFVEEVSTKSIIIK